MRALSLRVAFLTGQSDPPRCGLSPVQREFQAALAAPGVELVSCNYPWVAERAEWRGVGLLRASLANGSQYVRARCGLVPGARDARAWFAASAPAFLLVGSTGLLLLEALALDPALLARLHVFVYGGVGPRWPRGVTGASVLGGEDGLARRLGPADGPAPRAVSCGHLDYLTCPEVLERARTELARARERFP